MSTFLVTGGAGFIGSHLSEALLRQGQRVIVMDDLSSGSVSNVEHLRSDRRFEFLPEPVSNKSVLSESVDRADTIFHLAARVGVLNIIDSPVETIVNNIGGAEDVLKAAAKKRKKVIVASTSEVYGKCTEIPFREDSNLVLGASTVSRWSYAASKLVDEFLALAYWREFQVPTVVARLFNTIGPRQIGRYGMVVPRLLSQALSGQPLTVYGDGNQTRCFTFVEDVVEWLMLLAADDRAVGEVYNLGNPREVSITELAQMILTLTGSQSPIEYVSYEEGYEQGFEDMRRRYPDIAKIQQLTGYSPRVGLEEALQRIRDWMLSEHVIERGTAFHYTWPNVRTAEARTRA